MALNRCIVRELYLEQREYRCTAPSEIQQTLIDQLRDMIYKMELDEVVAHKTARDAVERAKIRRFNVAIVKKAMDRCVSGKKKTTDELLQEVKDHWRNIHAEERCGDEVVQPLFFIDDIHPDRALFYDIPEPVLKEERSISNKALGDWRLMPKYAWEDIHHRFLKTYGNSCRRTPTGFYDQEDEETGQRSKTVIIRFAASGELLVELNLGPDCDSLGSWPITIENVAENLGRWARRTRRPTSEGIFQNTCTFLARMKGGGTRKLERYETINDIFGNTCLIKLELVVESVDSPDGLQSSGDYHKWFESGAYQREQTIKRATKALRSTTTTNRHSRKYDGRLQRWLYPWESDMMRDYPDWEPITECGYCYRPIDSLVYCSNCPRVLCTRCCVRSGWPLKHYNVMCEDCTEVLQEALVE